MNEESLRRMSQKELETRLAEFQRDEENADRYRPEIARITQRAAPLWKEYYRRQQVNES